MKAAWKINLEKVDIEWKTSYKVFIYLQVFCILLYKCTLDRDGEGASSQFTFLTFAFLLLKSINNSRANKYSVSNISMSDQRCVVDQRCNNVDPTLKMKQNPTLDFQRCAALIQRRCPMLKQRWNNVDTTLSRRCFNVVSTLAKAIPKPVGLVISTDL